MNVTSTIDELLVALIDYRGKTPTKTSDGVPLITARVIKGGRISSDRQEFIAEEAYDTWMRRGLPKAGDVLITTEAPLGEVAQVGLNDHIALAQRVILLRPDPRKVDPQFFFHFLRSPRAQERLRRRSSGTTVLGIRQPELRAVEIDLLPRKSQETVGMILDSIDELIENNRRRIEVLEEMAQAIYREWFVHFRYPGHEDATFVDSPLGLIPEGWKAVQLVDVAELTMGQSPKSEFYNDDGHGSPFHQGVKDFGRHFPTHRTFCTVEGRRAAAGDILVSVRAPVGRLNIAPTDMTIGRGLGAARSKFGYQSLLFYALKLTAFATEDSMGSGTIFKSITKKDLASLRIPWPPDSFAGYVERQFAPKLEQIGVLSRSNVHLAAIRDLLLPKLVTGEIDVSELDLDALVEAAS